MLKFLLSEILVYLLGSIPFGLIISKLVIKEDIRDFGSHSIGATNVTRKMGKKWGALVLLLDGFKAFFSLFIISKLYNNNHLIIAISTIIVIFGHCYSIFLKFQGGKGIACLIFSLLFIDYKIGMFFLIVWVSVYLIFKISTLSALCALFFTTLSCIVFSNYEYFLMMLFLTFLIFYKHKENIKRLINKEELSFNKNNNVK